MKRFLRIFLFALLGVALARGASDLGTVEIKADNKTIPVRVMASTPELQNLALQAFGAHGRYRVVASGQAFDLKFTQVAPTQVRVEVVKTRGMHVEVVSPGTKSAGGGGAGEVVASETVSGTSARNALLKAADVAVVKTNGLGLKGFFTAKLTFISQVTGKKEVCVGDLFFGEVKQLTQDRAIAMTPRWAPDGSRIVYTSYFKNGAPDIYAIDLRTYQRTKIADFRGTNSGARFSPNGQQLAMVLSGTGNSEIWTANAQGSGLVRRTNSDLVKSSPCWSPDGGRLVFAMGESLPQLYVMPAGGGAPQRLASGSTYAAEPDWSAAAPSKIACTVRTGGRYQVAVYDFSKGKAEVVSDAPFDGIEASWLGDGRHVVYTARDRSTSVICILDTDTGKSTKISPSAVNPAIQASVLAQ